jgi:hypothetical protein
LQKWKKFYLGWRFRFKGPLFVLRYEDLKENLEETLRALLTFIGQPIDEKLFKCALSQNQGSYKRQPKNDTFDPFTPKMKLISQNNMDFVYEKLGIQQK